MISARGAMVAEEHGGIFTGERLVADDPLFAADFGRHLVAYQFAQEQARERTVLDAGCGDGYGTQLLAATAKEAVGVDRSPETIAVAASRYDRPNLRYEVCELGSLGVLGRSFELVCNFQVIEHLPDPHPFLCGVQSVLDARGCLIVTTPNQLQSAVENPYHVHEYTAPELAALLGRYFGSVEIRGVCADERAMQYEKQRVAQARRFLRLDPLGIRRIVPRRLIEQVYPHLARMVRRRVLRSEGSGSGISVENFHITSDHDRALDLLAVCRP